MPADAPKDPLAQLLEGTYPDPETGELLRCEARAIAIEPTLAGREVELVEQLQLGDSFAVLGDVDTYAALGERVARALESRFRVQRIVLPEQPECDRSTVAWVEARLAPGTTALIAVGSGTINDLAKLAALALDIPQVVFATAPSMNGFTSVSASIHEDGAKRSVRARTPIAAFFDLDVLAHAPPRLIRAGLGDSICRPTAQADWLLAHLLLDKPYREVPYALVREDERVLFEHAAGLLTKDHTALRALARVLVLSGFGMTLCGGSYPASQGEHLISHYLEMITSGQGPVVKPFHGEQVGVAALVMARLQTTVLERPGTPRLHAVGITHKSVIDHFGPERGAAVWEDVVTKQIDVAATNERLARAWPAMRARLAEVVQPPERLAAVLTAAGAPTTPAQIGFSDRLFAEAFTHARELRDRYTFLDFAMDTEP
ncbi:MAG TPA: iron-containing alcohol dehydrogenase [Kofleriaceae bacterium]|nr:iron-containing alcohol dehydrogenase [Kofleriaceae bacterium]